MGANESVQQLNKSLEAVNASIESASQAVDKLNQSALRGGDGFRDFINAAEASVRSLKGLGNGVDHLIRAIPGANVVMDVLSATVGNVGSAFLGLGEAAIEGLKILDSAGRGIDSFTSFSRGLNKTLFETVARFGGSFDAAKAYGEAIADSAQDVASAEFGFIRVSERIEAAKALSQAAIPIQNMTETIQNAKGQMDLLNTAILQSSSLGLDVGQYFDRLSSAIIKQGLSAQQAVEQMASFGDTSEKTGLTVQSIAGGLQGLAEKFSRLGLTADFGRPILENFVNTLQGMGLGIENAISLTESLSGALAELTSNYSAAFVTFQRGGLDFGAGGGALGAGIGLRAKMLEANETGDQGELGLQLAGALKETLASFTGGQIVTVQQAAMDPALQTTFFTQTQLLKDLYGIQDPGAQDRTLDLLSKLEQATQEGNTDLAESIAKDIAETTSARDQTLGYQDRTAAATEATVATLNLLNKNVIESARLTANSLAQALIDPQKAFIENTRQYQELLNQKVEPVDIQGLMSEAMDAGKRVVGMRGSETPETSDSDAEFGGKEELTVKDMAVVKAIEQLRADFATLASGFRQINQARTGSKLI